MSTLHPPSAAGRLLLGVTGGIAAYKIPDLVRQLRAAGWQVQPVMSRGAAAFVTPLTLQTVAGREVRSELFASGEEAAIGHIELARWPDIILIAPATAHLIARLAHGLADDLLTTVALASEAPIWLAPAMNRQMWHAAATQANLAILQARGIQLIGPASGAQACGEEGIGRMSEPAEIVAALVGRSHDHRLAGVRVTVTAGPTREAIDPVRYLGNRSSGKMGFAIAAALVAAGAEVRLIAGPVNLATPSGVTRIDVESAEEMANAALADVGDIFIAVAAVADFRPEVVAHEKIKRDGHNQLQLTLVPNRDILAEVGALPHPPLRVGFAAESEDWLTHGRAKCDRKGVDLLAANRVGESAAGLGFGSDDNEIHLFWRGGDAPLGRASKAELARRLVARIAEIYLQEK
jgi:phosphopantothenoylcysteine decarboxylase / phosphopantothenate---cysteine ligase